MQSAGNTRFSAGWDGIAGGRGIGSVGFKCPGKRRIRDESENRERFMADSHAVFGSEPNMTAEVA